MIISKVDRKQSSRRSPIRCDGVRSTIDTELHSTSPRIDGEPSSNKNRLPSEATIIVVALRDTVLIAARNKFLYDVQIVVRLVVCYISF